MSANSVSALSGEVSAVGSSLLACAAVHAVRRVALFTLEAPVLRLRQHITHLSLLLVPHTPSTTSPAPVPATAAATASLLPMVPTASKRRK